MRLFAFIGSLIVMVLVAALVAPAFIDWSEYRGRFEEEASRILRQPVRVAGEARARFLPFPSLTLTDVRVGPDEVPLMVARQFSLDAELAPFLSGEFLIFDMRIDRPVFTLDLDADGRPVWPAHEPISRSRAADVIHDVTVEKATVTGGSALLRDLSRDRQLRVSDLDVVVGVDSVTGPIRANGRASVEGRPVDLELSTGLLARDGFSVRARAASQEQDLSVATQGRLNFLPGGAIEYDGSFQAKPVHEDPEWNIEGVFVADASGVDVDQYRALFGDLDDPYIIEGEAALDAEGAAAFTLAARGNQINLEERGAAAGQPGSAGAVADIGRLLAQIPVPPMPGTVEVNLPAVIVGDTAIRDVVLMTEPAERSGDLGPAWNVLSVSAELPGRTIVEGEGQVTLGELPVFSGSVVVASRQPSGLAAWLGISGDERIAALSRAGLEADLDLTPLLQTAANVTLVLDETQLRGELQRKMSVGRPLLTIGLTGEDVGGDVLDALHAVIDRPQNGDGLSASHDVNLVVGLRNASYGEISAGDATLRARFRPERTDLDQLSINGLFAGSISATAVMHGRNGSDGIEFDVSAVAADSAAFLAGLANSFDLPGMADHVAAIAAASPQALEAMTLTADGARGLSPDDGTSLTEIALNGEIGGTQIDAQMTAGGDFTGFGSEALTLQASLTNAVAADLLVQLGQTGLAGAELGEATVTVQLDGEPAKEVEASVSARIGDTGMQFEGAASFPGPFAEIAGDIAVVGTDLGPVLAAGGLPTTDAAIPVDLSASMETHADGRIDLAGLAGTWRGSDLTGELNWAPDASLAGRGTLSGTLDIASLDLQAPLVAFLGHDGVMERSATVGAPRADWLNTDIDVSADTALLPGVGAAELFSARLRRQGGQLTISNVETEIGGAGVKGRLSLQNDGATVLASGQLSAQGASVGDVFPVYGNAVSGLMDFSFGFSADGPSLAALLGSAVGSGSVSTSGLMVEGLAQHGLPVLISYADNIGFGITPVQIGALADEHLLKGSTQLGAVRTPLTIAGGKMRVSNVVADGGALSVRVSAEHDVATWAGEARAIVAYDSAGFGETGLEPSMTLTRQEGAVERDIEPLVAFITQRALEREQARIEALQARLLERQRLRRALRHVTAQRQARLDAEEAARLAAEEERRLREQAEREQAERERAEREPALPNLDLEMEVPIPVLPLTGQGSPAQQL